MPMKLRISDFRNLCVWQREGPELPQQNVGLPWVSADTILSGPSNKRFLNEGSAAFPPLPRSAAGFEPHKPILKYSSIASNVTWAEKALTFHFQTHRSTKRVLSAPQMECSQFMCKIPLFLSLSGFLL